MNRCPKCKNENVRNVGKKELLVFRDKDGKVARGNTGRNKLSHDNEHKYKCTKCGWSSK